MQDRVHPVIAERPWGEFTRDVLLGNNLDVTRIGAEYDAGVLTITIPVAEHAKPRRIDVNVQKGSTRVESPEQDQQAVAN